MDHDTATALGHDLKNRDVDRFGALELHEDAAEFGESYSLHFHTASRHVPPALLQALGECGCGLSYLGERSARRRHLWLIVPEGDES